jgi:hypothetical protein
MRRAKGYADHIIFNEPCFMPGKLSQSALAIRQDRARALQARERLEPALRRYQSLVIELIDTDGLSELDARSRALENLTNIFRDSYNDVLEQIISSGKTEIGQTNSIKRSAGTNFQGLVEYALLKLIDTMDLDVAITCNSPKELKEELTIHGIDSDNVEFSVEPDIDMCIWKPEGGPDEPIILLSAKTSIVDRGGQAARWKMYLDMHQTACTYIPDVEDCPVRRTRVKMKTARPITHCIITANIYKIDTTQPEGELGNAQCRNNTFMFKYKYTTRCDDSQLMPDSWRYLSSFHALLQRVYAEDA